MKKNMVILAVMMAAAAFLFISCDSPVRGDEPRDWQAEGAFFNSSDEQITTTYYKPYTGYVGDPMPFYDPQSKTFKVPYLLEYRPNPTGTYHPIWGVETTDGANYTSLNEVIPCGGLNEQDAALGTGSMVFDEETKTYYFFYTGHRHLPQAGEATEAVLYATSTDCKSWTKCRSFLLLGADYGYSAQNFRDPFVLKMDDGKWHMLVSTHQAGKGVLAEFVSENLTDWTSNGVFMTMMWDRFYECPDLFKMGDWWYLVYSEQHSAIRRVQYFKGKTIADLKACTAGDAGLWPDGHEGFLNSRAFYAGKTASDGINRYIWGWVPTRDGNSNTATAPAPAEPNWGGTLVAHRVMQHEDGTLTLTEIPALADKYAQSSEIKVMEQSEQGVTKMSEGYSLENNSYIIFSRLGYHSRIQMTVTTATTADKFGVSLCRGTDSKKYYTMVFNPESDTKRKINFEEEGPSGTGFIPAIDSYVFDTPADNTYHITIVTDNSVVTMYVNDLLCYSNRIYRQQRNCWSINSYNGTMQISNLKITQY